MTSKQDKYRRSCYFNCDLDEDTILHRIIRCTPSSAERYNAWISVLDEDTRKKGNGFISGNIFLCYRHFETSYQLPNKHLTRNAVPTLNLVHYLPGSKTEQQNTVVETKSHNIILTKTKESVPVSIKLEDPYENTLRVRPEPKPVPMKVTRVYKKKVPPTCTEGVSTGNVRQSIDGVQADATGSETRILVQTGNESTLINLEDDKSDDTILKETGSEPIAIKQENVAENNFTLLDEIGREPVTIILDDDSESEDNVLNEEGSELLTIKQEDTSKNYYNILETESGTATIKEEDDIENYDIIFTEPGNDSENIKEEDGPENYNIILTESGSEPETIKEVDESENDNSTLKELETEPVNINQTGSIEDQNSLATLPQLKTMVEFIKENPRIASGGCLDETSNKLLDEMTNLLNRMDGATKTPEQWLIVWNVWKFFAIRKIALTVQPSTDVILSACETVLDQELVDFVRSVRDPAMQQDQTDDLSNYIIILPKGEALSQRVTTLAQRELMLDFIKKHPIIDMPDVETTKRGRSVLNEMTMLLNSQVPVGPNKTPATWLQIWRQWKIDAKTRTTGIARPIRDPQTPKTLIDLDLELLDYIRDQLDTQQEMMDLGSSGDEDNSNICETPSETDTGNNYSQSKKRKRTTENEDGTRSDNSGSKKRKLSSEKKDVHPNFASQRKKHRTKFKDIMSLNQRKLMLEFVKKHPIIATRRFSESINRTNILDDMAQFLNRPASEGATMTPEHWFKSWQTWKSKISLKAAGVAWHTQNPGTSRPPRLTETEQELVDFLKNLPDGFELIQEEVAKDNEVTSWDEDNSTDNEDVSLKNTTENVSQLENGMPQKHMKISLTQKELMLDFMKKHPGLAASRNNDRDVAARNKILHELADLLNSQESGGAVKTPWKWLKTWEGWRIKTKMKAMKNPPVALTDLELQLIQFVNSLKETDTGSNYSQSKKRKRITENEDGTRSDNSGSKKRKLSSEKKDVHPNFASQREKHRTKQGNRSSIVQLKLMLDFVKEHPIIVAGRYRDSTKSKLLNEMADLLNSLGSTGATKSPKLWLKTWFCWKSNTKLKAAALARHAGRADAAPALACLTDLEQELLEVQRDMPQLLANYTLEKEESYRGKNPSNKRKLPKEKKDESENDDSSSKQRRLPSEKFKDIMSLNQRKLMLEFVKKHPIIATRRFSESINRTNILDDMAQFLNRPASEGATMTPEHWFKSWQTWKSKINLKAAGVAWHTQNPGTSRPPRLTETEQELVDFLKNLPDGFELIQEEVAKDNEVTSWDEDNSTDNEDVSLKNTTENVSQLENGMPQKHMKTSLTQKELMLDFMKKHPGLAASLNNDRDVAARNKILHELADLLNSQESGGAVKTPWKWLKTWEGWRIKTKMKAMKNPPVALTDLELQLIQFVNSLKINVTKEDDWRWLKTHNLLRKNMCVSNYQRKLMLDFIKKYPLIISKGHIKRKIRTRLMIKMANLLNGHGSSGRAVATSQQWLKSWSDWKYATLRKADAIAKHAQCPDAGPPPKYLTDLEQEMIDFLRALPDILDNVREEDIEASLANESADDDLNVWKPRIRKSTKPAETKSSSVLQHPTFEQRKIMFEFVKQHPVMAIRRFRDCKNRTKIMNDMAEILNQPGIEGPVSTPQEWFKSWQRWKSKIKWKSKMRQCRSGVDADMKRLEQQVLDFLNDLPDPKELLRREDKGNKILGDEDNSKIFEEALPDCCSCSMAQLKLMLNFIKKYPVMATECFDSFKNSIELNEMTNRLNDLGDTKSTEQWLKVWRIYRAWATNTVADLSQQPRGTAKVSTLECLSEFERDLLDFIHRLPKRTKTQKVATGSGASSVEDDNSKNCETSLGNETGNDDSQENIIKKPGNRSSHLQLKLMLEFMKKHPLIASGRLYEVPNCAKLLEEMENHLNAEAATGARKDARLWLKTWHFWKFHTKNKAEAIAQHVQRPDKSQPPPSLTPLQQELLDFLQDLPKLVDCDDELSGRTEPIINNMDDSSGKRYLHKKYVTTYMQRKLMMEFIKKHPQILSRGNSVERTKLLQEMADILNSKSCSGLTRCPENWLDIWHNWKSYAKKKAGIISRNPDNPPVYLSDLDKELLDIVNTFRDPYDQVMDIGKDNNLPHRNESEKRIHIKEVNTCNEKLPTAGQPLGEVSGMWNKEKENRWKCLLVQDERRKMVLRVYNYFETEYELLNDQFGSVEELTSLAHTIRRTADALGLSKTIVMSILETEAKRQAVAEEKSDNGGQRESIQNVETEKILSRSRELTQNCLDGGSLLPSKEECEENPFKVRLKFEDPLPEEFDDSELAINDINTPVETDIESLDSDIELFADSDIDTLNESDIEAPDIPANVENIITESSNKVNLVKIEVIDDVSEINTVVTEGDVGYKEMVTSLHISKDLGDKTVTEYQGTSKDVLDYEEMITKYHDMSNEQPMKLFVDNPPKMHRFPGRRPTPAQFYDRLYYDNSSIAARIPSPRHDDDLKLMETEDENVITSGPHSPVTISQDDLKLEMTDDGLTLWTSDFVKIEPLENNSENCEDFKCDIPWRYTVS